jgi:hypothetical protein
MRSLQVHAIALRTHPCAQAVATTWRNYMASESGRSNMSGADSLAKIEL